MMPYLIVQGDRIYEETLGGTTMQQLEYDVGEILGELVFNDEVVETVVVSAKSILLKKTLVPRSGTHSLVSGIEFEVAFSGPCELREKITKLRNFLRDRNKPKKREWRIGDVVVSDKGSTYFPKDVARIIGGLNEHGTVFTTFNLRSGYAKSDLRNLTIEAEEAAEK